ncbi:MAG: thioredoxin [Clostridia bacterium]|nr:thioredoxin [Clostridia bacterium]
MAVRSVDEITFEEAINSGKLVLVDFWATWCGPCKALAPILEEVSEEIDANEIEIVKLDIDQNVKLARKFGVMSVPTVVAFKDGKGVLKAVGARPKEDILTLIDEAKKRIAQA